MESFQPVLLLYSGLFINWICSPCKFKLINEHVAEGYFFGTIFFLNYIKWRGKGGINFTNLALVNILPPSMGLKFADPFFLTAIFYQQ